MRNPDILTASEIAELIPFLKMIERWIMQVKERVMRAQRRRESIPGYKLVEGRSNRVWKNPDRAARYLADKLTANQLWKKTLITPTQAEKILGLKNAELQELISKPPGRATLVEIADPRSALDISLGSDFDDLDDLDVEEYDDLSDFDFND